VEVSLLSTADHGAGCTNKPAQTLIACALGVHPLIGGHGGVISVLPKTDCSWIEFECCM